MLKNNSIATLLMSVAIYTSSAHADDLKGEGEFGYTSTSGNTDTKTLNAKLGIGKKIDKWDHNARLELLKSSSAGIDSANSIVFTEKSEYRFAEKTFAYGKIRHEEDDFSGFDHQSILSFGAGHVFTELGKHALEVSLGLGYRDFETDAGIEEQEAILDGELKYAYKISETSKFNQNFFVEAGDSNTYSKSETSLKLVIVGNLGAKFSYEIKNNSDVPPDTDKTDTVTTVTLVYNF